MGPAWACAPTPRPSTMTVARASNEILPTAFDTGGRNLILVMRPRLDGSIERGNRRHQKPICPSRYAWAVAPGVCAFQPVKTLIYAFCQEHSLYQLPLLI